MIATDERNRDVLFPVANGEDFNSDPEQNPSRFIINFGNLPKDSAARYELPFSIIEQRVRPAREKQKNPTAKRLWWQYYRYNNDCYQALKALRRCFVAAATTKYLNFSVAPTNFIFLNTLYIFTTDRWDLYAVVQSNLHEVWARKYSGALETRLRYSPTDCFETFAFPEGLWQTANPVLAAVAERYHQHRKSLMLSLWLGLTDIYNLFHSRDLTPEKVAKVSKKPAESERGYAGLLQLRHLQVELDLAIRDAYGWHNLPLNHDFYEVETLAENDRRRALRGKLSGPITKIFEGATQ